MSKIKSIFISSIPTIIIAGLIVTSVIYAWKEPTALPPQENVPAPINVGTSTQTKKGGLIIGKALEVNGGSIIGRELNDDPKGCYGFDCVGLIVEKGKVGIGTTTPQAKLEVVATSSTQNIVSFGTPENKDVFSVSNDGLTKINGQIVGTYYVEADYSTIGITVPLDMEIVRSMCSGPAGCKVTLGEKDYLRHAPDRIFSRATEPVTLYIKGNSFSLSSNASPTSISDDLIMQDNEGTAEHLIYRGDWGCYLTDAKYTRLDDPNPQDNDAQIYLLRWRYPGGKYPSTESKCFVSIESSPIFKAESHSDFSSVFLVDKRHRIQDCINTPGGSLVDKDGNDANEAYCSKEENNKTCFCKFNGGSCPSGWTQYKDWSATKKESCRKSTQGNDCYYIKKYDAYCETGAHQWSNTSQEMCKGVGLDTWSDWHGCSSWNIYCSATALITQIGCY